MAARRLLAAMLVFLAISTVLAALAPRPADPDRETTTTTGVTSEPTPAKSGEGPGGGALVRRRIDLGEDSERGIPTVSARPGDQLALTISAPRALTVEGPSLGITEAIGPDAPARLDLFLTSPGRHLIVDAESGRRLARIVVGAKADDG